MVHVSGSLTIDNILKYSGKFSELDSHNVSLQLPDIEVNYGGTAGNIAYNLALLDVPVTIYAPVGEDFSDYKNKLNTIEVSTNGIYTVEGSRTATSHTFVDADGNQFVGFHRGAMCNRSGIQGLPSVTEGDFGIISAGNIIDMDKLAYHYIENKIRYMYDPGQDIQLIGKKELQYAINNAEIVIANQQEMERIEEKLGCSRYVFGKNVPNLITTLGDSGSVLLKNGTTVYFVKAVDSDNIVDTIGAGDAYRAGLVKRLLTGYTIEEAMQYAAVVSSFSLQSSGGQNHKLNPVHISVRYMKNFTE